MLLRRVWWASSSCVWRTSFSSSTTSASVTGFMWVSQLLGSSICASHSPTDPGPSRWMLAWSGLWKCSAFLHGSGFFLCCDESNHCKRVKELIHLRSRVMKCKKKILQNVLVTQLILRLLSTADSGHPLHLLHLQLVLSHRASVRRHRQLSHRYRDRPLRCASLLCRHLPAWGKKA